MPKDAYYFPHDYNARNDPKMLAMRSVYGMWGVGVYWCIIEMLREQPGYKIELTQFSWGSMGVALGLNPKKLKRFVEDCEKLFTENGKPLLHANGFIYSDSLIARMELYQARSEAARTSANKRWEKEKKDRDYTQQKYGNVIRS